MNILPINYNISNINHNFKGKQNHKENKHIAAKTIIAASALTAAAVTGMVIAKRYPNSEIINKITSPFNKFINKTNAKILTIAATTASAASITTAVDISKDDEQGQNSSKPTELTENKTLSPEEIRTKEKELRLQEMIDEIQNSKVEPKLSDLKIDYDNLVKPTKEEVKELPDGNKINITKQYTKVHKIVTYTFDKPINGIKKVEQIKHPDNKLSMVNIYDTTNKLTKSTAFKYNYESGKLIDITMYDKEFGRRSKIKYIYNDNYTRLEKVVTIGADGRIAKVTRLPISIKRSLKNSISSIQDGFSEAGDKLSNSIRRLKKMAMF